MNKPTLDKVRDYFYGRCNDGEEVRIQQWFADNGNSSEADRLLGALLDEVRSENPALAQAAFEEFCRRIGHSVPARTAPRRLTTVVRWTQRIAAVLIVPLLIAVSLLYTKTAHTPEWEEVLVPAGQRSEPAPCRRNAPVAQFGHPRNLSDPLQRPPAQNLRGRRGLRRSHARQAASLRHLGRRRRGRSPRHQIQHAGLQQRPAWSKWRWSRAACVST